MRNVEHLKKTWILYYIIEEKITHINTFYKHGEEKIIA